MLVDIIAESEGLLKMCKKLPEKLFCVKQISSDVNRFWINN